MALLSFSASALKCAARDGWIGWHFRRRSSRLKLVINNSRFLILPEGQVPNLGSRVLSLCQRRLASDWEDTFGHRVLLLETFVDPRRFRGTVYRAANWVYVGNTRGFRRARQGYTAAPESPKMVFVQCGMRGYRAISDWAPSLGQKSRERFGCRREADRFVVPSEYVLRNVLSRVEPAHWDRALQR